MAMKINTNIVNDRDGYLLDAKSVKGGYTVVATFDDLALLPPATQVNGSLAFTADTKKTYRFDGTNWTEESSGGGGGSGHKSTIGDVILSKTLDTMSKVVRVYGGLTWELIGDEDGLYQWEMTEDDIITPLCFTAEAAGSNIKYHIQGTLPNVIIQKSTDNIDWVNWDGSEVTLANVGDKLYVRNLYNHLSEDSTNYLNFTMTRGKISASGVVDSLLNYQDSYGYCYYCLFKNCNTLTKAPRIKSFITGSHCYDSMFYHCQLLVEAPTLPATQLAESCYESMFYQCYNLTQVSELPSIALAKNCYKNMYSSCSKLEYIPRNLLPATQLVEGCYYHMFYNCSWLKRIMELPAGLDGLAIECYSSMFLGCGRLKIKTTGESTNKVIECYSGAPYNAYADMFRSISSESEFSGTPSAGNTYYWYE